jgi:hypothetical protein
MMIMGTRITRTYTPTVAAIFNEPRAFNVDAHNIQKEKQAPTHQQGISDGRSIQSLPPWGTLDNLAQEETKKKHQWINPKSPSLGDPAAEGMGGM